MPERYFCQIAAREKLADDIFAVTVGWKEAANTRPGQFIHIKCGDLLLRRPISICSVSENTLKFVFEVKGEGTSRLSQCKVGEVLDILGPLGNGFTLPQGRVIAVGGGIGVPPMLHAAQSHDGPVTAVLGFRDKHRVILKSEFESVCDEVIVTTDDGSAGIHGPVTKPLEDLLKADAEVTVLACGPRAMLQAVAQVCEKYGAPCRVSLEERMGCGVGACLVCACATRVDGADYMQRVCKDGPVFNAREVVW